MPIYVKPRPQVWPCQALGGDLILKFRPRVGEFDQSFVLNDKSLYHALLSGLLILSVISRQGKFDFLLGQIPILDYKLIDAKKK